MTSELDNALQKTVILKMIDAMASTSATLSGYHSSVGPEKYNWSSQFSLKFENVLMTATAWLGGCGGVWKAALELTAITEVTQIPLNFTAQYFPCYWPS